MITSPARAGIATHSAVSISGAARCSVFCHENQSPKAPLNRMTQTSTGLTPANQTNTPNSSSAAAMANTGSAISEEVAHGIALISQCRAPSNTAIRLAGPPYAPRVRHGMTTWGYPIDPTTPSTR